METDSALPGNWSSYSGVMDNQRYIESREGVPQGGPLSPLLANIMLDPLDKELERRGL